MVTPTTSWPRVANVAKVKLSPGQGGQGEDLGTTMLTSLSPCLQLTGTAPSINFRVCTWGHKYQLTTPSFPMNEH